jgi:hypothetical protein
MTAGPLDNSHDWVTITASIGSSFPPGGQMMSFGARASLVVTSSMPGAPAAMSRIAPHSRAMPQNRILIASPPTEFSGMPEFANFSGNLGGKCQQMHKSRL